MKPILFLTLLLPLLLSCPITPNTEHTVPFALTPLSSTTNGQKFVIGDINSTDRLFVAKLKGTPYEMGKAFGEMFKAELEVQLKNFFAYYSDQVLWWVNVD